MIHVKIEPILRENLLLMAKAYAAARGVAMTTVSRYAANGDPPFFAKIADGRGDVTMRKYDEVAAWFKANWPKGSPFPKIYEPWRSRRRAR